MTKRFVRKRRKVRLTPRDGETLKALFEARYLTNRMVCRLFYSPTTFSYCKQRLRYLFDGGYIGKRKAYPNEPDVYFLALKGRRYVATVSDYHPEQIKKSAGRRGEVEAPFLMMGHDLTLSKLYVNAVLECRKFGWTLTWQNTRMLELKKLGVQPDAYLQVQSPRGSQEALLEYTAVLPTKKDLTARLIAYDRLFARMDRSIPILWLTTTSSKLRWLCDAIKQATYSDFFLIGLVEDAQQFLTEPIWWWSERDGKISWIESR